MTKGQQSTKTITRPQFEALRTAGPIPEWQGLPETHGLYCLKERHEVIAQPNTIKVLKRLGLVEVAKSTPEWGRWMNALTPAGELVAASLKEGSELPTLDHIAHVVETMAKTQQAPIVQQPEHSGNHAQPEPLDAATSALYAAALRAERTAKDARNLAESLEAAAKEARAAYEKASIRADALRAQAA